jgi:hypothetical protein
MSFGSGEMLANIHSWAEPLWTCHNPGPARSPVTRISSTLGAGSGPAAPSHKLPPMATVVNSAAASAFILGAAE